MHHKDTTTNASPATTGHLRETGVAIHAPAASTQPCVGKPIRKGDRVFIKPEWQDKGDENIVFLAVEDEDGPRILIEAQIGFFINPTQRIETSMIVGR